MKHLIRNTLLILWILFIISSGYGQRIDELKDTIVLDDVLIEVKKKQEFSVGNRITSVDSLYTSNNASANLSDALENKTSIYIKSYGNGMSSSVSFRGTGASHTAVLWNGFNIANASLGQSDFSLIPLFDQNSVLIMHGSSGANYGSGSIGGTIFLSSIPTWEKKYSLSFLQDVGSFGHYFSGIKFKAGTSKLQSYTRLYNNTSANDFLFRNIFIAGKPWEHQVNSGIRQYGFMQDLDYKINKRLYASIKGWYNNTDRNLQPSMGAVNSRDRQIDENVRITGSVNYKSSIGNTYLRSAYLNDFISFRSGSLISNSRVISLQGQLEHELRLKEDKIGLNGGVELQNFKGIMQSYGGSKSENRASIFALIFWHPFKNLQLNLNIRKPFVQGFNPPLTPAFGINYRLYTKPASSLNVKFNISKGYRVPSLNDRFWTPGGNPNLKPELSQNFETGVYQKIYLKKVMIENELTLYTMKVDNWIQWKPLDTVSYWMPFNISLVQSQGIEFSCKAIYKGKRLNISSGVLFGFTSAKTLHSMNPTFIPEDKQLIYVPLNKLVISEELSFRKFILTSNFLFTGYRYVNAENTKFLPGFGLLNLSFGKSFTLNKYNLYVFVKANNILNQSYQTVENKAMPLRNYMAGIRININ